MIKFLFGLVRKEILTINVPVVYMARDVMILWRANPFRGTLDGAGPENRDFFDPECSVADP
jgi:hypothetical protein